MNRAHGTLRETSYTPKLAGLDDLGSSLITLQVDIQQLRQNIRIISDYVRPAALICVVKANAYGFGAAGLVPLFSEFSALTLAVATPDEALELRAAGWDGRIILLGYTHPKCYYQIVQSGCELSIYRPENIPLLAEMARPLADPLRLHVKVDTGMTRLGVPVSELENLLALIKPHGQLKVAGLFSHLVDSSDPDNETNLKQAQRFEQAIRISEAELGYHPECHLANTGAILNYPQMHYDSVRIGQLIYGVYPPGEPLTRLPLTPCYRLTSEVVDIHRVQAGEGVSYGHSYIAGRAETIVTLPFGYADGQPRRLSNRGSVLIRGKRYPIVGNITMDYAMVSLGDDEVAVGDEAVYMGKSGAEEITMEEVTGLLGVLPYEISCAWGRRVRRVYFEG